MRVGIAGHQKRKGIEWSWVKDALSAELRSMGQIEKAFSSLAAGSDQVFAEAAISLGIPVVAIIPLDGYERFFKGSTLAAYQRLLGQCEVERLIGEADPERAFFEAGQFVVDQCDLLFAVWDGEKAEGFGGTADIVEYAIQKNREICRVNPLDKTVAHRQADHQ